MGSDINTNTNSNSSDGRSSLSHRLSAYDKKAKATSSFENTKEETSGEFMFSSKVAAVTYALLRGVCDVLTKYTYIYVL